MTPERRTAILDLLGDGEIQSVVAERFGVSKNVVAGIWRDYGGVSKTTLYTRCDALNRQLDAVLAETRGIGRVPNVLKLTRVK
jgi:hypothetical protein